MLDVGIKYGKISKYPIISKHRLVRHTRLCYGCETWACNNKIKGKLNASETNYLRRNAGISRLSRPINEKVRVKMKAQETVPDIINKRWLIWFGHLLIMPDRRWPKRLFHWTLPGRRKRGRP